MTNETQATQKWPTRKQAGLLLLAGIVLGVGGCAMRLFIASVDLLATIGAGAFVAGVVLFLAGFVALLVRFVRSITGK
jgi:hypothetical protein